MRKFRWILLLILTPIILFVGYISYPWLMFLYDLETWKEEEQQWNTIPVTHSKLPVDIIIDSKSVNPLDQEYQRKVRFVFNPMDTLELDLPIGDVSNYMNFYLADSTIILMEDQMGNYYFDFLTRELWNFPFYENDTIENQLKEIEYIGAIDGKNYPYIFKTADELPWQDITQP